MKILSSITQVVKNLYSAVPKLSWKKKAALIMTSLLLVGGGIWAYTAKAASQAPTYTTETIAKGTLIASISGSGTITTGNTTSITTGATGTVSTVYVKNGDTVQKGDKIAEIKLDEYGQKRLSAAYLSYTTTLNAVKTAQADKTSADIQMWQYRQAILDAEEDIEYKNNHNTNPDTKEDYTLTEKTVIDKSLELARANFAAAETKYKNADASIQNSQVRVTSAWYDYQQVSSTVTAPESGVVQNLELAVGTVVSNTSDSSISISDGTTSSGSSSSSNTLTTSSQSVGFIKSADGQYKATVSLTEVDIPSIKSDQKVTLTMDAFPDNTFTGKVLAVDTNGTVSSGVTSYPVTILLDSTTVDIYTNMAVSANIITLVKPDVLLVTTSAISTSDSGSTVQVMKNGKPTTVTITIGSANDSQTEVSSGLNAGDVVITSTSSTNTVGANTSTTKTSTTTKASSIFSGSSMGGMGGGMSGGPPPGQ